MNEQPNNIAQLRALARRYPRRNAQRENALVLDLKEGWGLEYIENPVGDIYWYKGKPVSLVYRSYSDDGTENLVKVERPTKIDVLPEKLYRALHWMECKVLFTVKPSLLEKLQTWATIALLGLLMLFLIIILGSMGVI